MCILVHAVKRQPLELPLEGRISNALVEVGPSITLASLSEVLAFAVGSFIPMPACRVFSMFAGYRVSSYLEFPYFLSMKIRLLFVSVYSLSIILLVKEFDIYWQFVCSIGCSIGLPSASYCFCCLDCV